MKVKPIIATVGLAVAASSAMADNFEIDFDDVGGSPGGSYFDSSFVTHAADPLNSFVDILKFSLPTNSFPAWQGLGTIADQPKVDGSNIENLTAEIFTDAGADGEGPGDASFAKLGTGDYLTGGGLLLPGAYYFKITGTATGPSPSAYTYTASVTPVPEPGSYAMMLAGLGLMGFIAARRNSRQR